MDIVYIETKINEILAELEKEAMDYVLNESLDKKATNLHIKPIVSTKQILLNAVESIKMVEKMAQEEIMKMATK
jgi:hypothetical protein